MNTHTLALVATVFLAAGLVKGLCGLGLPTLSMALLGLAIPPASAAALMVLPALITNVAQCLGPHWRALLRRLWPMWLGTVLATVFCPLPALGSDSNTGRHVMAAVLAAYGLWGLSKPKLPNLGRYPLLAGSIAGLLSGLLTAATGVFVMPMVPYLQALRLGKAELMQAMGISFTLATLALALRLSGAATVASVDLRASAIALFTALVGMGLGNRLLGRLQPAVFQRILYGVFLVLGGLMAVSG